MTGYAVDRARRLPRGWAHLALQLSVWLGFYAVYQVARGAADRGGVAEAFENGRWIIRAQESLGTLVEPSLQAFVERSSLLLEATSVTYWLSQFAVVGLALLWVYVRHHERFYDLRNVLIVSNLLGLLGYVIVPTAPPRMFPEWGFSDTLAEHSSLTHEGLGLLANPYAAMPSLHSMDALIVGVALALVVRTRWAKLLWLAWAPWVWFSVMSTGNHFWLDVAAGIALAGVGAAIVLGPRLVRRRAR